MKLWTVALFALLALIASVAAIEITTPLTEEDVHASLKICGNYCGPSWCSATKIDETSCVKKGIWGKAPADGCADNCCKIHDKCCANTSTRPSCNNAIVSCLSSCSGACAWAVRNAMKLVGSWCCGTLCPRSLIRELDAALNITDHTPDPFLPMILGNPDLHHLL